MPATSNIVVLSYGCQYQGGFLYAVDDTTDNGVTGACSSSPCAKSIGGKVASLTDQAAPRIGSGPQASSIIWSSNGSGSTSADVSYDIIPLISDVSVNDSYSDAQLAYNNTYANTSTYPFPAVSDFSNCNGASQGACNTSNILALYDAYKTGYGIGANPYALSAGPTVRTDYAAGLCTATINTYSDWYLPAICEMDSVYGTVACPIGVQSMVVSLSFLVGDPNAGTPSTSCSPPSGTDCLAGLYWSSTQVSAAPLLRAWLEVFDSNGSIQFFAPFKDLLSGVRCSRALTI